MGDAHVAKRQASNDKYTRQQNEFATEYAWGRQPNHQKAGFLGVNSRIRSVALTHTIQLGLFPHSLRSPHENRTQHHTAL
jgi:hypothetical protein